MHSRGLAGKNSLFDPLDLFGERVEHREIPIHDRVHQRVQHIRRSVLQQLGLLLASPAHFGKTQLRVTADRDHVLGSDENGDFAGLQIRTGRLNQVQDDEQRRPVLVDLRPLMALLRVFNRQLVKAELCLERRQLAWLRVLQRDPDEAIRPQQMRVDLAERNVGELLTVMVSDTVDEHGRPSVPKPSHDGLNADSGAITIRADRTGDPRVQENH